MSLLEGKTVVMTGGDGGLGRCYGVAMAKAGATVVVTDINLHAAQITAGVIRSAASGASLPLRKLSKRLVAAGVRHRHEEFDGDHSDIGYRMDMSLPFLYKALKP